MSTLSLRAAYIFVSPWIRDHTSKVLLFIFIIFPRKKTVVSGWYTTYCGLSLPSLGWAFRFNRLESDDKLPQINCDENRRLRHATNNALFNAAGASAETRQISESTTVNKFRVRRRQITYDVWVENTPTGTRGRVLTGYVDADMGYGRLLIDAARGIGSGGRSSARDTVNVI